ncbi:MAG: hypothetical protein ABR508_06340 [Candidatus Baltobacteraceae bacterium]
MNSDYGTSAYFTNESDARRAAEDLRAQGCEVDVRSEGSHGQSFWESIKSFFSGESNHTQYASGAIVQIDGGDPLTVRTVVTQYNGRLNDSTQTMETQSTASNSLITGTATGGTGFTADDETGEYTGARTSGTGTMPNAD